MTTKVLREEIHELVDSKDDEALLQKVLHLLEGPSEDETEWWDEMTDEQRQQQEEADEDIRLGRNLISHEEAMKRASSWLKDSINDQSKKLPKGIEQIVHMLLQIDDVESLEQIHLMLRVKIKQQGDSDWWNHLTEEEQAELERAEEEIKNEENLIPHEEVMAILSAQLRNPKEAKTDWWDELEKP